MGHRQQKTRRSGLFDKFQVSLAVSPLLIIEIFMCSNTEKVDLHLPLYPAVHQEVLLVIHSKFMDA